MMIKNFSIIPSLPLRHLAVPAFALTALLSTQIAQAGGHNVGHSAPPQQHAAPAANHAPAPAHNFAQRPAASAPHQSFAPHNTAPRPAAAPHAMAPHPATAPHAAAPRATAPHAAAPHTASAPHALPHSSAPVHAANHSAPVHHGNTTAPHTAHPATAHNTPHNGVHNNGVHNEGRHETARNFEGHHEAGRGFEGGHQGGRGFEGHGRADGPLHGGHSIPEARFHAGFGPSHSFRIGNPILIGGQASFQFGGLWFGIVDPWPVGWAYTDAVYVDFISGGYFLVSPVHPGIQVAVAVGDPAPATCPVAVAAAGD